MLEIFKNLENNNFWRKKRIPTGFSRKNYLNKLKKYIGNNLIKVLIGQRRVGKSYLLRQIIKELISKGINPKNIFYLNKELIEFDAIKTYRDLFKLIKHYQKTLKIKGKIYLLLDEIQEIKNWEKLVNSLSQDYKNKYEIFITGSNSKLLSGELATYLSGRYVSFEIFPFLFEEYTEYHKLSWTKNTYLKYLKTGGLPELFKLNDEEIKLHYVSSLKSTILLKDIVERHKIKDAALLDNLFKFFTDNIGNLFSINSIVSYLNAHKIKTNHETISNYIEHLKQTFLIHEVDRFDIKGKSILASTKKYYLNDLSFKNYLSSGFDYGLGKHLENSIYLYLKAKGYQIYIGSIYGREIDFIAETGQDKKYIQVAYSLPDKKVINRELRGLEKIKNAYEKIIITLDDTSFGNKDGIKHVCAWEINEIF